MKFHTLKTNCSFFPAALLAAALVVLNGCTSWDIAKPVKAFNDATTAAMTTTRQAFDATSQIYIRRTVEETIAGYPADHSVLANLSFTNLNPFLSPEHLQARLDVLEGLQKYSERLSALAGNEQLDAFDQQAAALAAKLSAFNGDIGKMTAGKSQATPEEIAAFTAGVREIGRWLIIREQRKAVRAAITHMQTNVDAIATFLAADLQDLAQENETDYHQIVASLKLPIKDGSLTDPAAREERMRLIADTVLEGKKSIAVAKSLAGVATGLAEAHQLLTDAVTQPNTKFTDLVNQISGECQNAKSFYDSLNKAK